ncbi:MAG: hypothetical protein U0324_22060 [Polyangiales bacterium]
MNSKYYRSFEEFAREEIRPMSKIGWSLSELDFDAELQTEDFAFAEESGDDDEE